MPNSLHQLRKRNSRVLNHVSTVKIGCCSLLTTCFFYLYDDSVCKFRNSVFLLGCFNHGLSCIAVEDSGDSQSESENSVSDSVDDNDDSVAEISRSFRSRQELCEQLNVNHMIQRIFLITLDNSKFKCRKSAHYNSGELSLSLQKCPFESSMVFVNVQKL